MKRYTILFFLLLTIDAVFSQHALRPKRIVDGDIYALIVGVSQYSDGSISDLNFAHRDAERFRQYLKTRTGGQVPDSNIILLTDSLATIANIYNAKYQLEQKVKSGDLLYFYFSGHGDVENDHYQLGFLLAHDSPRGNYLNNAVRIEDINIMANTLSIDRGARVIMITDACRSGKLADENDRRVQFVGLQNLKKSKTNEIRITSCQPEESSQEGPIWGGGSGAFTFHLINGLMGFADGESLHAPDGKVELDELENYLRNVTTDVLEYTDSLQHPTISGQDYTKLSWTHDEELELVSALDDSDTLSFVSKSVRRLSSDQLYFDRLNKENLNEQITFSALIGETREEIIEYFIDHFPPEEMNAIEDSAWVRDLQKSISKREEYGRSLAATLHGQVQKVINAYLRGDKEELERREYFNAYNDYFDNYIDMMEVAMNLVDIDNRLHHILKVKHHYFKGLQSRFSFFESDDKDRVWHYALDQQNIALTLDPNAAYVNNEIGVLYQLIHDDIKSIVYFAKASDLSPYWSLPLINLSHIYLRNELYYEAHELALMAVDVQPGNDKAHVALGMSSIEQGMAELAQSHFTEAIRLNPRNRLAVEGLGLSSTLLTAYERADHFFTYAQEMDNGILMEYPVDKLEVVAEVSMASSGDEAVDDRSVAIRELIDQEYAFANLSYKQLLQNNVKNPYDLYTLARINAQLAVQSSSDSYLILAEKFLELADENGFDHTQVLIHDPLMEPLHETKTYTRLVR